MFEVLHRAGVRCPGSFLHPYQGLGPDRLITTLKFKYAMYRDNPLYFKPCGTMIFCGSQGEGKTLSAVDYINNILSVYPHAVLCTNVHIRSHPFNTYLNYLDLSEMEWKNRYRKVKDQRRQADYDDFISGLRTDYSFQHLDMSVDDYISSHLSYYCFDESSDFDVFRQTSEYQLRSIYDDSPITPDSIRAGTHSNVCVEYWGLDCLKYINNAQLGVIFLIDEIHLELNSLESKNVPIEVMIEISQQRKQRKHIVGTSQRYNRLAKPLREQVRDIVACKCFFGCVQYNKLIDGDSTQETPEGLKYDVRSRTLWFHSPLQYLEYDTYAKMHRYNNEWKGRPQVVGVNL